ncbi:MAG TPA: hypothetical protein VNT33_14085 [Telluria sp.]|nr:hypothetical protein [Telluria sp.]
MIGSLAVRWPAGGAAPAIFPAGLGYGLILINNQKFCNISTLWTIKKAARGGF